MGVLSIIIKVQIHSTSFICLSGKSENICSLESLLSTITFCGSDFPFPLLYFERLNAENCILQILNVGGLPGTINSFLKTPN